MNRCMLRRRHTALTTLLFSFLLPSAMTVMAGPDSCEVSGATITCTGDQSNGVAFETPPDGVNTWIVDDLLAPIVPPAGIDGIRLRSTGGQNFKLESGRADRTVNVEATGSGARGIFVESVGRPREGVERA